MRDSFLRVLKFVRVLLTDSRAQDLVEYGLIVAVMALGSIAGEAKLATGINLAFNDVSSCLSSSLQ
jgi:Flp pilus assembly pilin Flp